MTRQSFFYASIEPELKKKVIERGALLSVPSGIILILSGSYLPPEYLADCGWILSLTLFTLIAWSWKPFQELRYLEKNPYKISISEDSLLIDSHQKMSLKIEKNDIISCEADRFRNIYGITLVYKKGHTNKEKSKLQVLEKKHFYIGKNSLFIPFFNKQQAKEIKEKLEI